MQNAVTSSKAVIGEALQNFFSLFVQEKSKVDEASSFLEITRHLLIGAARVSNKLSSNGDGLILGYDTDDRI